MPSLRVAGVSGCEIGLEVPCLGGRAGALLLAVCGAFITVWLSVWPGAEAEAAFAVGLEEPGLGGRTGALLLAVGFAIESLDAAFAAGLDMLLRDSFECALSGWAGSEVTLSDRAAVPSVALASGLAGVESDGSVDSGLDGSFGAFVPPLDSLGSWIRLVGGFGLLGWGF